MSLYSQATRSLPPSIPPTQPASPILHFAQNRMAAAATASSSATTSDPTTAISLTGSSLPEYTSAKAYT